MAGLGPLGMRATRDDREVEGEQVKSGERRLKAKRCWIEATAADLKPFELRPNFAMSMIADDCASLPADHFGAASCD